MHWKLSEREPSVEELLDDEIMTLVLRSAGTDAKGLLALLHRTAFWRDRHGRGESVRAACCVPA